jgi:sensor c-di-GMP phosphodiesterase-like protein
MIRRPAGIALAAVVGIAAVVAPIWISLHLAWRKSMDAEMARVRMTASEVLRHTDEAVRQNWDAYYRLKDDRLPACSPAEIDLMRAIDMSSFYIQAVGRIEGDSLTCTSLGTTEPIPIGPAKFRTESGAETRPEVRLPIAANHPLEIISKDGIAVLYDPMLLVDTPVEGSDVSMALFVPSRLQHEVFFSNAGPVRPEWLKNIPRGGEITFVDSGYIVCAMRSRIGDVEVLTAAPLSYAARREQQFAVVFVPVGLACGALLAWVNVYISRKRLSLAAILRDAVRRREFYVEYQPIVELATRRWVGAEALVRWRRGKRVVRPDMFIPIAEEMGVIGEITECVFEAVARDLPSIIAIDPDFSVAINLSAADLGSEKTLALLHRTLDASGAKPANIELEVTERGFLKDKKALELIAELHASGVKLAIDDFGTGYSSLSRLQTLPVDTLKIDKSFVDTVDTDGVTSQVISHIIEMAQSLKLDLVAEGVETEKQMQFLVERGVQHAQGWLFGKPMPASSLCAGMAERSKREGATRRQAGDSSSLFLWSA